VGDGVVVGLAVGVGVNQVMVGCPDWPPPARTDNNRQGRLMIPTPIETTSPIIMAMAITTPAINKVFLNSYSWVMSGKLVNGYSG